MRASSLLLLALVALGGSSCGGDNSPATFSRTIDASGGSLAGPGGATVVFPVGATTTPILVTLSTIPPPAPPAGTALVGTAIRLGPSGTTFPKPIEMMLTVDSTALPVGTAITDVVVLRADQGTTNFTVLPTRPAGGAVIAAITEHFSDFIVVAPLTSPPVTLGTCGDSVCGVGEACASCPRDCGLCLASGECGNLICDGAETCASCTYDCPCTQGDGGVPQDSGTIVTDASVMPDGAACVFMGPDVTCDGVDDDCNGVDDDGYPSMPTACGLGACARAGVTSCALGAVIDSCVPGSPSPSDATCDGIDDDCDGVDDDGYLSMPTACGLGGCTRSGATSCNSGVVSNTCIPGSPTVETCNGVDDDCNGTPDNGNPGGGAPCSTGLLGVCSAGTTLCTAGSVQCIQNVSASTEICINGIDENCDGVADDGC